MKLEQAARQVVDAWDLGEFSTRMDEAIAALREALAESKRYNHETGSVLIPNPLAEQATVSGGLCGGCAKKAADGWALYCVECWEKDCPCRHCR